MKLLLAEDSALLRAGLEQLLSALGHSVTAATDAEELRAIAGQEDFDLIITDVRMPPTMTTMACAPCTTCERPTPPSQW